MAQVAGSAKGQSGQNWVVRRRWAPRLGQDTAFGRLRRRMRALRRRARGLGEGIDAVPDGCVDVEALVIAVVVVVVVVLAVFFVIPFLVALVDLVVVLLLALLGVMARVVFRRPWVVDARADDGTVLTWKVVGWRASGQRRDEIAQMLAAGITPPDGDVARTGTE